MKKILVLTLLMLSFAGSALASRTAMTSNAATIPSISIYGGNSQATVDGAVNPLIKLSSKVIGVVNFTSDTTLGTSPGYAIGTKHGQGSKVFGTAFDSTTIFFLLNASGTDLTGTIFGSATGNANFVGGGWTAY